MAEPTVQGMNNNVAVLQVGPLMQTVQDAVANVYGAVRLPDSPADQAEFLAHRGHTFDVAVTSGRFGVGTELMRALPNLRAVVNFGVGYDTTDTRQATERGIAVSNTPDVLNDCVADTAVALYVDVLRRTAPPTATSAGATGRDRATSPSPPRRAASAWAFWAWAGSER